VESVVDNPFFAEGNAGQSRHGADPRVSSALPLPEISSGTNPLVRAANRLVNLIPQIRAMAHTGDLAQLRERLASEIRLFEQRALEASVPQDQVIGARYCLCTVLDETAMQTPWGSNGEWAQHSLLTRFHDETWGGEKYFQLLSRVAQNPQKHLDLLELMYFCIALGFEGRFRVIDNGRGQLETLRQRLATIIQTAKGERERGLSPHWRGEEGVIQPWRVIPAWVVATVCGAIGLIVYITFSFLLADRSDPVFAKLAAIDVPSVQKMAPVPVRDIDPVRLRKFLEPEITEGLVEVQDLPDRSVVTILGDGLFDSGRADVKPRYDAVLRRIAQAMNEVPGTIVVAGYTDNVPSRSIQFPSNWHLSQARAAVVLDVLGRVVNDRSRMRAEGRGEAEPVADNRSSEGRAKNRRVEITLLLPRAAIESALNAAPPPTPATREGGAY
jgi:type VI secretion system protein ImpK